MQSSTQQSTNLIGRPRKVRCNRGNVDRELKKQAAKDSNEIYALLFEAIKAGEPWAFQLYFQELLPKTDILPIEIDPTHPDKLDAIIFGLLKSINMLEYVSIHEVCELLNALSNLLLAIKKEHAADITSLDDVLGQRNIVN